MKWTVAILVWTAVGAHIVAPTTTAAITEVITDPKDELLIAGATTSTPLHDLDDWNDWETWEAPAKIVELAPFYKAGHDKDELPVYVLEYGKWNYRGISNLSEEEVRIFHKYCEKLARHETKDGEANNHQGIVSIIDWDGFALKHLATGESLKLALRDFLGIVRLSHVLEYGFSINTNYAAETFMNLARPLMGNLFDKIQILGTRSDKWKPELLRKIPMDQLPPHYGGDKDWKPVPLA